MGCCGGGLKYEKSNTSSSVAEDGQSVVPTKSSSSRSSKNGKSEQVLAGRILRPKFIVDNGGAIEECYEFDTEVLGAGSYGSVFKCCSKATGAVRAVKTITKTHARYADWVRSEAKIMKLVDHPNIIKLYETFEDSKNLYLVMELCTGGGLAEKLKTCGYFTEVQVAFLMRQILRTISYMHKKGICHRDLKPENFLLVSEDPIERNVLKIIDFGVSCRFEENEQLRDKAGTPFYTSPQVLDGRYTEACDLWSCGVIMYIMMCGVPPFTGNTDVEVWSKIRRGNFAFQSDAWKKASEDAKNLIRGLMKYKEIDRFTAREALNHHAIQSHAPRGKDVKIRSSVIGTLRQFAFSTKFKKAALHAVAQTSREDQVKNSREIFLALDIDDDGFVTFDELQQALSEAGLTVPADLESIAGEVDADRSGAIDYTEFLAATISENDYLQQDRCWAAFLIFDRDGDGKISREELELALGDPEAEQYATSSQLDGTSGEEAITTPQAVSELLKEADTNCDGVIDFEEFMEMMQKGCKNSKPRAPRG